MWLYLRSKGPNAEFVAVALFKSYCFRFILRANEALGNCVNFQGT